MNKELKNLRQSLSMQVMIAYFIVATFLLGGYIYFYQYTPLEETWNTVLLNVMTSVSALLVAGIASNIYTHYQKDDFPKKIWLYIMIASWFWFYAEATWGVLAYLQVEVPTPSIADIGWFGGFVFFSLAFYHQYSVIYNNSKTQIILIIMSVWVLALLIPWVGLTLTNTFTYGAYVNYYYPIADFALGAAGIALMFVFQGGALGRAWIGPVILAISDFSYAWAEQSGLYAWTSENNNVLTLAIDSSYLLAYLVIAFGFLGHWILINYGLRPRK